MANSYYRNNNYRNRNFRYPQAPPSMPQNKNIPADLPPNPLPPPPKQDTPPQTPPQNNQYNNPIMSLLNLNFGGKSLDKDTLIVLALIYLIYKEGKQNLKLLLALGYILI